MTTVKQLYALAANMGLVHGEDDAFHQIVHTVTGKEHVSELTAKERESVLYDDVIAEISKINYQSQQEIQNLFRNAGIESVRNDNIFYKPTGNQVLRLSDSALQVLNAGYQKCAGNLQNLTLTTANNAQQLYLNACNLAYMQVTSSAMDYGTAIRRAVQMASQQGSMVSYPSGHRDQLDVAVRRAVLTGIGQTVRQISVINANDMGCDLMEITAHAGARPSHAHWQGQIVSLSGRRGYLTVRDIGYGDADGFGGINCRHDWYPFFEGISQRTYSPERLQKLENHRIQIGDNWYTDYEVSQMQRRLERDIREKKRLVAGARASVDSAPDEPTKKQMQELFTNASVRLKKAEKKLDDFCKQTGFRKDNNRVWVNGFGRSTSQKAVWANRKAKKTTTQILKAINPSSSEYLNSAKITRHSKEERRELVKYAKDKGIRLFGISRFDGDSELLKEQIDAIAEIRREFKLDRKLTVCFKQMSGDDLGETRPRGEVIYLNKKAFRERQITHTYLNSDNYLSSTSAKGIGIHEMGHVISIYYGEKGLDIAQKAYYNIYKREISHLEIFDFLESHVSEYSTFLPDELKNKPFRANRYKEITPEILAKHMTNPDDFTTEFVRLLKEACPI